MNRRRIISQCLILATLIGLPSASLAQSKESKCPPEDVRSVTAPPYKIGRVTHSAPNYPPKIVIYISIEPKYFVRADMLALAGELNRAYCTEKRFAVIILDDYDALVHSSPIHNIEQYGAARRGVYRIDRSTGEEAVQFSTERGKPIDEIKINLGKRAI